jgi:hypothetical protein
MSKGIAYESIAKIILYIVLPIVVIGLLFFTYAPEGFKSISESLGLLPKETGAGKASVLIAAIKCSYYRCVEGCNSDNVKDLKIGNLKCKEDFCKPGSQDSSGKVCGDNSKNSPVAVTLSEDGLLSLDDLSFLTCLKLSPKNSCNYMGGNMENTVTVQASAVKEETLVTGGACRYQSYKSFVVKAGSYNVWTTFSPTIIDTVVCTKTAEEAKKEEEKAAAGGCIKSDKSTEQLVDDTTKGTCEDKYGKKYEDYCKDDRYLVEYYCDRNKKDGVCYSKEHDCGMTSCGARGCKCIDGKCEQPQPCKCVPELTGFRCRHCTSDVEGNYCWEDKDCTECRCSKDIWGNKQWSAGCGKNAGKPCS